MKAVGTPDLSGAQQEGIHANTIERLDREEFEGDRDREAGAFDNEHAALIREIQRVRPVGEIRRTEARFSNLAHRWHRETDHLSVISQKVLHPAYQQMIGLGPDAVPLILHELLVRPGHWSWALNAITGEDPVLDDQGGFGAVRESWLNWGREHGLLRNDE